MNVYIVDGKKIKDINSLCAEFSRAVNAPDNYFGFDYQSFDDCLFGGFGLNHPCKVIWTNSNCSKKAMDCHMLIKWCESLIKEGQIFEEGFEEGKKWCLNALAQARQGKKTYFDEIIELIASVTERSGGAKRLDLILE